MSLLQNPIVAEDSSLDLYELIKVRAAISGMMVVTKPDIMTPAHEH